MILRTRDRKSTRLNSSHVEISYAVFCLKKKNFDLLAGLGVFEGDDADVGQYLLAFVLDVDGDEVMPAAADRERVREIRRLKIGNEKHDRGIRPTTGRLEKQDLAN